jgi:hypothetical protein
VKAEKETSSKRKRKSSSGAGTLSDKRPRGDDGDQKGEQCWAHIPPSSSSFSSLVDRRKSHAAAGPSVRLGL